MRPILHIPCSCAADSGGEQPGPLEPVRNRTPFQMAQIEDISKRPGFIHLCGNPSLDDDDKYRGPVTIAWFERDDQGKPCLHSIRLGAARVLNPEKRYPI